MRTIERFLQPIGAVLFLAASALAGCSIAATVPTALATSTPSASLGASPTLAPVVTGSVVTSLVDCNGSCTGTVQTVDYPITVAPTGPGQAIGVAVTILVTNLAISGATGCNCQFPYWQLISPAGEIYQGQSFAGPGNCYGVGCGWGVPTVWFNDGASLPGFSDYTYFAPGSAFNAPAQPGTWQLRIGSTETPCQCSGSASWLVSYSIQQGP